MINQMAQIIRVNGPQLGGVWKSKDGQVGECVGMFGSRFISEVRLRLRLEDGSVRIFNLFQLEQMPPQEEFAFKVSARRKARGN